MLVGVSLGTDVLVGVTVGGVTSGGSGVDVGVGVGVDCVGSTMYVLASAVSGQASVLPGKSWARLRKQ